MRRALLWSARGVAILSRPRSTNVSTSWTLRARKPRKGLLEPNVAEDRGALGSIAARVLMKILWVARVA
eukprot:7627506-Alexandrium_andersonii.AAC.1